jgi:hypothetical protein
MDGEILVQSKETQGSAISLNMVLRVFSEETRTEMSRPEIRPKVSKALFLTTIASIHHD